MGHDELEGIDSTRGMYLRDASPQMGVTSYEESPFASIIHSFWFVIVTITTVGYGDMYPVTRAGKTVTTFMILLGIVVIAMPVGVIGSNFSNEYAAMMKDREKKKKLLAQYKVEQAMIRESKKHKKNTQG